MPVSVSAFVFIDVQCNAWPCADCKAWQRKHREEHPDAAGYGHNAAIELEPEPESAPEFMVSMI